MPMTPPSTPAGRANSATTPNAMTNESVAGVEPKPASQLVEEDRSEEGKAYSNAFGRLLRFWRGVMEISQTALSESLETSSRHISFLENGRSNPSRAMINRLARVLDLNERDKNVLLMAAGFNPGTVDLDLHAPQNSHLLRTLQLMLEKQDPYPALILDRSGDVKLLNRGLYNLFRCYLDESLLQPPLNLMQLYFSHNALRTFIQDWEFMASHILFKLHQESLLTGDAKLMKLFDELRAYPGVPGDWALRAKEKPDFGSYQIRLKVSEEWQSNCQAVISFFDVGEGTRPPLEMHSFYPGDETTKRHWVEAATDEPYHHPLLPY